MKSKYEITCEIPSSDGWHSWVIEDADGHKIYIEGADEDLVKNIIRDANQKAEGNAAAMREALEQIIDHIDSLVIKDDVKYTIYQSIVEMAKRALSTPARNCDRFTTFADALNAWREFDPREAGVFDEWLFAEAKGEKK